MESKLSVIPTVKAHLNTLRDDTSGRLQRSDFAVFYVVPIAVGVAMWLLGVRLSEIGGYLGGLAVFTALLFALVIFVFQLRVQISDDSRFDRSSTLFELIDQIFSNVCYAVVIGVLTTGLGVVAVTLTDGTEGAPAPLSSALAAFALHLVLTIFMCIKRIQAAYCEVAAITSR
ncbi:hypothetical protein [Prescottella equi]|uniref:hypothetical protein n=1 Tax=Rhodococcus hoagii TaxID=43767 RepID=UPI000A10B7EB|nr:hypothetical protein [Prescottella equi]ORL11663.1 hypothetical protein A6I85_17250 [Prescottella equi]